MTVATITGILKLTDQYSPVLMKVGQQLQDTGSRMNAIGSTMASTGSRLSMGLTAPLVAAAGAAFKFSNDFNKGMANVASLMPGNIARVQELKVGVQELAIVSGKSTGDLTDGLYMVVSAFGDTSDTLKILNTNARAATAGLATTEEAINLTSAVTKGYGDTSLKAVEKVADLAQMTVKLGQTTFPELAASIGRVTPLTAALGVSQEELFTVMATGTGVTGKAAEVSTQLRGILQALMAPTDSVTELMKGMGVESGEAMLAKKGLHGTILALVGAAQQSGAPLQKYIGSIEGQTLALALAGGQSSTYVAKLAQMKAAAGESVRAFDEQTKGINATGFMFEQLKSKAQVYLQQAGDQLAPSFLRIGQAIGPVLDSGMRLLKWFADLPAPVQSVVLGVGAFAAAIGPLLLVMGTLLSTGGQLLTWTGRLVTAGPAVATSFGTMGAAAGVARLAIVGIQGAIVGLSIMAVAKFVSEAVGLLRDQERWRAEIIDNNTRMATALSIASKIAGRDIVDLGEAAKIVEVHNAKMRGGIESVTLNMANFGSAFVAGKSSLDGFGASLGTTSTTLTVTTATTGDYIRQLAAAKAEVQALTRTQYEQIEAGRALGISTEALRKEFGLSEQAMMVFDQVVKAAGNSIADMGIKVGTGFSLIKAHTQKVDIKEVMDRSIASFNSVKVAAEQSVPGFVSVGKAATSLFADLEKSTRGVNGLATSLNSFSGSQFGANFGSSMGFGTGMTIAGQGIQGTANWNQYMRALGFYHDGGYIQHGPAVDWSRAPRRHSGGGLMSDEVPMVGLTGEGVLSRTGMRALDRLNDGQAPGASVSTAAMESELRAVRQLLGDLPGMMFRAMRDASIMGNA